jgi:hypothetical protein
MSDPGRHEAGVPAGEIPFYSQAVIGYRQWLLIDGALCPLFTCTLSAPWLPGVNEARCYSSASRHAHDAPKPHETSPQSDCSCGLYARHEVTDTMRRDHIKGRVTGAIAAWGDLEVHHDGFRAQFAMVCAVAESASTPVTAAVADRYGVPLLPLELIELEATRHGAPLPVSARPPAPDPERRRWSGPRAGEL